MTVSRICIVGPGAIGGMMAVKFMDAGFDVSVLVRPHRVDSLNESGFTLLDDGKTFHAIPRAASDPADLGAQDLVIITVKEYGLKDVAPQISLLLKDETQVVQVTNGIPWWFFADFGGDLEGRRLESVDAGGCVATHFEKGRHIGGVINCGVSVRDDGTLSHDHSNNLYLGRPDNVPDGVEDIVSVFKTAGYNAEVADSIHQQVMTKLLANISFNPVSALTMGTLDVLLSDDVLRDTLAGLMDEGRAVATALGLNPGPPPTDTLARGSKIPPSKTSMLQDMEQGKPLELDGILGSTIEVAGLLDVPVPLMKSMYGLLRVHQRVAALREPV